MGNHHCTERDISALCVNPTKTISKVPRFQDLERYSFTVKVEILGRSPWHRFQLQW